MLPTDDTLQPGEQLIKIAYGSGGSDLKPGSAIRVWHPRFGRWIPGWWCEVLRVEGDKVYLRDLQSGKQTDTSIENIKYASWYAHPAPERLPGLGQARDEAQRAKLGELRAKYEALDFTDSTEAEMIEVLRSELKWRESNQDDHDYMKDEFGIHEIALVEVGKELDRRGGMTLMRRVFSEVPGTRRLEGLWGGIGDWRG